MRDRGRVRDEGLEWFEGYVQGEGRDDVAKERKRKMQSGNVSAASSSLCQERDMNKAVLFHLHFVPFFFFFNLC